MGWMYTSLHDGHGGLCVCLCLAFETGNQPTHKLEPQLSMRAAPPRHEAWRGELPASCTDLYRWLPGCPVPQAPRPPRRGPDQAAAPTSHRRPCPRPAVQAHMPTRASGWLDERMSKPTACMLASSRFPEKAFWQVACVRPQYVWPASVQPWLPHGRAPSHGVAGRGTHVYIKRAARAPS